MIQSANPARGRPKVAISYSWEEEKDGPNQGQVSSFQQLLLELGVDLIRGNNRLNHEEILRDFIHKGTVDSNYLLIFISNGYFKSIFCMSELLTAWKLFEEQREAFSKRVTLWIMPGLSLAGPEERLRWVRYWANESSQAENASNGWSAQRLSEEQGRITRIREIAGNISEILNFIVSTLNPRSVNEFVPWVLTELKQEASVIIRPETLAPDEVGKWLNVWGDEATAEALASLGSMDPKWMALLEDPKDLLRRQWDILDVETVDPKVRRLGWKTTHDWVSHPLWRAWYATGLRRTREAEERRHVETTGGDVAGVTPAASEAVDEPLEPAGVSSSALGGRAGTKARRGGDARGPKKK